jgi:hypothetical protein
MRPAFLLFVGFLVAVGCGREVPSRDVPEGTAQYFKVLRDSLSGSVSLVSISPYDGMTDTLSVAAPFSRIIVLSTSYVGFLDALGCDSVIAGVSGLDYVSAPGVVARGKTGAVQDVGYDADPDYEKILSIDPDVLVAYTVSAAKPPFLVKLESLGVRVFIIHEQLDHDVLPGGGKLSEGRITRDVREQFVPVEVGQKNIQESLHGIVAGNFRDLLDEPGADRIAGVFRGGAGDTQKREGHEGEIPFELLPGHLDLQSRGINLCSVDCLNSF